jgi:hypothetical protein
MIVVKSSIGTSGGSVFKRDISDGGATQGPEWLDQTINAPYRGDSYWYLGSRIPMRDDMTNYAWKRRGLFPPLTE